MQLLVDFQDRPVPAGGYPSSSCWAVYDQLRSLGFRPGRLYDLSELEQLVVTLILAKHNAQVEGPAHEGGSLRIPPHAAVLVVELSALCGVVVRIAAKAEERSVEHET